MWTGLGGLMEVIGGREYPFPSLLPGPWLLLGWVIPQFNSRLSTKPGLHSRSFGQSSLMYRNASRYISQHLLGPECGHPICLALWKPCRLSRSCTCARHHQMALPGVGAAPGPAAVGDGEWQSWGLSQAPSILRLQLTRGPARHFDSISPGSLRCWISCIVTVLPSVLAFLVLPSILCTGERWKGAIEPSFFDQET